MIGVFGAEMALGFRPPEWDQMLEFLGSFGQPTHCFWTIKTARVDGWTKIVHVCCL